MSKLYQLYRTKIIGLNSLFLLAKVPNKEILNILSLIIDNKITSELIMHKKQLKAKNNQTSKIINFCIRFKVKSIKTRVRLERSTMGEIKKFKKITRATKITSLQEILSRISISIFICRKIIKLFKFFLMKIQGNFQTKFNLKEER